MSPIKLRGCKEISCGGDSKLHLVGWDKVCAPLKNDGLGVRKLTTFNEALLGRCFGGLGLRRQGFGEGL